MKVKKNMQIKKKISRLFHLSKLILEKGKHRRFIVNRKIRIRYSHLIWNLYNPNDKVKNGEIIHHKDGNQINDNIDNLDKMTQKEHSKFHMAGQNNPNLGRKFGEKSRRRMSLAKKDSFGKKNNFYGKKHSFKTKRQMSLLKACKLTEEKVKNVWNLIKRGYEERVIAKKFNVS